MWSDGEAQKDNHVIYAIKALPHQVKFVPGYVNTREHVPWGCFTSVRRLMQQPLWGFSIKFPGGWASGRIIEVAARRQNTDLPTVHNQ